jgi:lipoyl synthase
LRTKSVIIAAVQIDGEQRGPVLRKPTWLRVRVGGGEQYAALRRIIASHRLNTVCQSASCPNRGECWNAGTATLMILGEVCTRDCRFCDVPTGAPAGVDLGEPDRVASAVALMKLRHVVITCVTRDDLPDGGGAVWAATVPAIRAACPATTIEVLPSDFAGRYESCRGLLDARPDVFGHNVETVPRLYPSARPQADYQRSLTVLDWGRQAGLVTKSALMVGLGETFDEVAGVLADLRRVGVSIVAIGQYLQPSRLHLPVTRYVPPEEFARYAELAGKMGFTGVAAAPLVRSSYHAEQFVPARA